MPISYVPPPAPVAGVEPTPAKFEIPWGLIGVISVVGLLTLGIVAVVVGGRK